MRFPLYTIVLTGFACLVLTSGITLADIADIENAELATEISTGAGYRHVSDRDEANRAAEYMLLESGPTFDLHFFRAFESFYLGVDAKYLGNDEYSTSADFNGKGKVRLSLRNDRFVHNLDHVPYANGMTGYWTDRVAGPAAAGSRTDDLFAGRQIYFSDQNPYDDYRLRLDMTEAKARIKAPDYPAHLNIAYWRYEKSGEQQLRFYNHDLIRGRGCNGCHVQSKTRPMNTVTEEIKVSADAHAGPLDVVLETLYRTFRDKENIPQDYFIKLDDLQHDESPDSTLRETTLRLNTAPASGFFASGSYTIGKRENQSNLTSEAPIKAETDYSKATLDLNYTPKQAWTYNLRYRRLDMNSSNSEELNTPADPDPIPVRGAIDNKRDWYEATVVYRPSPTLSFKGELLREDIQRSHDRQDSWDLPEDEVRTRFKLGFYSKHFDKSALKLRGWGAFQHINHPAYGISAENQKELFLSAHYTPAGVWGLAATLNLQEEENNGRNVEQDDAGVVDAIVAFDLDRRQIKHNFNLGGWVNVTEGVTLDVNYGYFMTAIEQDLLFGTSPNSTDPENDFTREDKDVDFQQTVHTLRAGVSWQALDNLNCRLEGYHIRSRGYYSPDFYYEGLVYRKDDPRGFPPTPGIMSSADLRDISEFDIRQNGLRGTASWQIDDNWSCAVNMTFDDYDAQSDDLFDGTVLATMVSISRTW